MSSAAIREEIIVIGYGPGSGGSIVQSAVRGGWALGEAFADMQESNPVLAEIAAFSVGAALGGAPKSILKKIGGEAADQAISRGADAFGAIVGSAVESLARRKGWAITLVVAGIPGTANAAEIGTAAGAVGSTAVSLALGVGASAVSDGVRKVRKSLIDRSAFRRERQAFWRNEAARNPEAYSAENLALMRRGRAPIGRDGYPMELHHEDRTPGGPLVPMTRTDHRLGENYLRIHPPLPPE